MFNQLYLSTFLVIVPICFFLLTSLTVRKNLNFISPQLEERIVNSKLFIESISKTVYILFILLCIYMAFIIFIVFSTKELIFLMFIGMITLPTVLSMVTVFSQLYISISDFEIRVSRIKEVSYTEEQEKVFKSVQTNILIYTLLGVFSNLAVSFVDAIYLQSNTPLVSFILFLVAISTLPIFSQLINGQIKRIDMDILQGQKGYLNANELKEFKDNLKEKSNVTTTLTDLRNSKVNELKKAKVNKVKK